MLNPFRRHSFSTKEFYRSPNTLCLYENKSPLGDIGVFGLPKVHQGCAVHKKNNQVSKKFWRENVWWKMIRKKKLGLVKEGAPGRS